MLPNKRLTPPSSHPSDGAPHHQCADVDGAALQRARRRKECTYPELSGAHGRAKLVVLAAEVGGRWSNEAQTFLRLLVRAKDPFTARGPPSASSSSMAFQVELSVGVFRSKAIRLFSA